MPMLIASGIHHPQLAPFLTDDKSSVVGRDLLSSHITVMWALQSYKKVPEV